MSTNRKRNRPEKAPVRPAKIPFVDLFIDGLAFFAVFAAMLYCCRTLPTAAGLISGALTGAAAVPLARFGRRIVLLRDSRWTLGLLLPLIVFFAGAAWACRDYPFGEGFSVIDLVGRTACFFIPTVCLVFFIAGIVRDMARMQRRASYVDASERAESNAAPDPEAESATEEKTYLGILRLTKEEAISLAVAGCLIFALRIAMYLPVEIVCDEYYHSVFYSPPEDFMKGSADTTYKTGRFTTFLLTWAVDTFVGASPFGYTIIGLYVGFVALLAGGIVLSRLWGLSKSIWATTSILLFLGLHPYIQNMFFYRGGGLLFLGLPCVLLPFLMVRRGSGMILPGAVLIALGLGLYQAFLNAMAAAYLIDIVLEGARELQRHRFVSFLRLWNRCRVRESFYVVLLGCFFYLILGGVFRGLVAMIVGSGNYTTGYLAPASFSNPADRFAYLFSLYARFFAVYDAPFAAPLNVIPVFITFLGILGVLLSATRRPDGDRENVFLSRRLFFALFLIAMLFLASYFAVLGILSLVNWSDFPPRIVMFLSIFFAGSFALSWTLYHNRPRWRRTLLVMVCVLFLAYSIFLSELITDSYRILQIDRAKAVRMIYDLEKMPEFPNVRKVCFIPYESWRDTDLSYPIISSQNEYLESAFAWFHARVDLLNAVSGYEFQWPRGMEFQYMQMYSDIPVWPAQGSIVIDGDTAVIRLK